MSENVEIVGLGARASERTDRIRQKRITFGKSGEERLSRWMGEHAFVVWNTCDDAWPSSIASSGN